MRYQISYLEKHVQHLIHPCGSSGKCLTPLCHPSATLCSTVGICSVNKCQLLLEYGSKSSKTSWGCSDPLCLLWQQLTQDLKTFQLQVLERRIQNQLIRAHKHSQRLKQQHRAYMDLHYGLCNMLWSYSLVFLWDSQ